MTKTEIQGWLTYWRNANMVAIDEIHGPLHVAVARKWCLCMRTGVFENVSNVAIWNALRDQRISADWSAIEKQAVQRPA